MWTGNETSKSEKEKQNKFGNVDSIRCVAPNCTNNTTVQLKPKSVYFAKIGNYAKLCRSQQRRDRKIKHISQTRKQQIWKR